MSNTRQKIIDAAFDVFAKDLSAPLEKVADAADISRMTLHRYFKTRQDLLEAMWLEFIDWGNQIIDESMAQYNQPRDQLQAIVMRSAEMGDRFHFLMHASEEIDHETHQAQAQEMEDKMMRLVNVLRSNRLLKEDLPTAWIMHLYDGVLTAS